MSKRKRSVKNTSIETGNKHVYSCHASRSRSNCPFSFGKQIYYSLSRLQLQHVLRVAIYRFLLQKHITLQECISKSAHHSHCYQIQLVYLFNTRPQLLSPPINVVYPCCPSTSAPTGLAISSQTLVSVDAVKMNIVVVIFSSDNQISDGSKA